MLKGEDSLFGFDIFSKYFGYILWYLFDLTKNYGTAVCIFALLISIVTFPIIVKRNRSMVSNERFEAKKEDLRRKCGNDRRRFNKECMDLAEKEQITPSGSGTLSMLLTMVVFFLIYGTVQKPLTNVLHLQNDKVSQATSVLTEEQRKQKGSDQLDLVRSFSDVKDKLDMFSEDELKKIEKFSKGFKFCGINLLNIPKFSGFGEMLWVLPILSFLLSAIGVYVSQKVSGVSNNVTGIGKYLIYLVAIFQAWIVSRVFAVLGVYLMINSILATIQTLIIERFFSAYMVTAKKEKKKISELINH